MTQRRAAFDHAVQRIAHAELGFGIHTGSGFVEDQDLRIVRQRPGKRDQLLLPGGKRAAALAHFFVESSRQRADEVGEIHVFGGLLHVSSAIQSEPRRMFPPTVPVNRNGSCNTTPKRRRRSFKSMSLISTPSMRIAPFCTS